MNKLFIFTSGVIVGAGLTYACIKGKYEKRLREEVDSFREGRDKPEIKIKLTAEAETYNVLNDKKEDTEKYEELTKEYSGDAEKVIEESVSEENISKAAYIISMEDYKEVNSYEKKSLNYYTEDEVLTDDEDNVIEDIDGTIGNYAISCLETYDDEVIYIRNEKISVDYEVVKVHESFSEYVDNYN